MDEHRDRDRLHPDDKKQLNRIERMLDLILKGEGIIMADLQAEHDQLLSILQTVKTDADANAAKMADLNQKLTDLQGAAPGVDFGDVVALAGEIQTSLEGTSQTVTAAAPADEAQQQPSDEVQQPTG